MHDAERAAVALLDEYPGVELVMLRAELGVVLRHRTRLASRPAGAHTMRCWVLARVVASARQRSWSGCGTLGGMTGIVIAVGLRGVLAWLQTLRVTGADAGGGLGVGGRACGMFGGGCQRSVVTAVAAGVGRW